MEYYDLDKILAEEEKLKIKFDYNIQNFGFYINPGLADIKSETRADLPFFLVKFLLLTENCTLLENPLEILKNDLEAKASIVDLKNRHFYTLNKYINDKEYLTEIFYERIGSFVSLMVKDDFSEEDLSKMSFEERKILLKSRRIFNEFQDFFFNKHADL